MLIAHIVPGYFAVQISMPLWNKSWTRTQKAGLWFAAVASTIVPDLDVVYNILFRGFANHSVLWTHSLFPYLGIAIVDLLLPYKRRWSFERMLIKLFAIGGMSHLVLDVIVHGTPLFYPLSTFMVGYPPQQIVDGGLVGYLTHPIFLLEPLLLSMILIHYRWQRSV